jgi:hypothetical protein
MNPRSALLPLLLLLSPLAASLAAATTEGTWTATIRNDEVDLAIRHDTGSGSGFSSSSARRLTVEDLRGLDAAAAVSAAQTAVTFELRRDAGTVHFEGVFREGRGSGHFTFAPSAQYPQQLAAAGVRLPGGALGPRKQLLLHTLDLSPEVAREMAELGYGGISLEELIKVGIFDVTPQMVLELRAAGYRDLPLARLVELRIHGVTVEFLRELEALGVGQVPLARAIEMRIHGVTPAYVRELEDLGYTGLTPAELVEMRIFGVTPELIRKLAAAGYDDLSARRLIELRIHGADAILLRKGPRR